MISRLNVPFYSLERLTRAEQIELAELREIVELDPLSPNLTRLNVLLGKATAPDLINAAARPRRHPREIAREEFQQRRERGGRSERRKWEHEQ